MQVKREGRATEVFWQEGGRFRRREGEREKEGKICLPQLQYWVHCRACVHREEVLFTMAGSLFGRLSLEEGDSANSLEGLDIKLGVEGKHKSPYLLDCVWNSGLHEQKWVCKDEILLNVNYSNSTLVCMFMVKEWLVGLDRTCSRCTGSKSQSVMKMSEDRPGPTDVMYRNLRQTPAKKKKKREKIRKRDIKNKTARGHQKRQVFIDLMYNKKLCSNTNWKANSEGIENISRGAACICCFNNKAQIMFAHTAWNEKVPYILFIIDGLLYCSRRYSLHSLIIVVFLHLFDVIMLSQSVKRKHTPCHTVCTLLHVILHHVT